MQAILDLRARYPYAADEVSSIHVAGNEKMAGINNIPAPADILMAQYSIPFCIALAHVRDPHDPRSFDDRALRNPQIMALAQRVKISVAEDCPTPLAAAISVTLADGRVLSHSVTSFKGTPEHPLDQRELRDKFLMITRHCRAEEMGKMLDRLERLEDEPNLDWIAVRGD